MATIYLYVLITLTDYNGTNVYKEECGMILLGIVILTISVNIIKVIVQVSMLAYQKVKRSIKLRTYKNKTIKIQSEKK
jgi:hypothetical protein